MKIRLQRTLLEAFSIIMTSEVTKSLLGWLKSPLQSLLQHLVLAVAVEEVMVVVGAGITTETVEVLDQIDSFMVETVHVLTEFQPSILCTKNIVVGGFLVSSISRYTLCG